MSSTFGSIQQAGSGLAAARYGLEVVSQNIANADTPGYVRRAAQQASMEPVAGVSRIHVAASTTIGVQDVATTRLNDPILDARAWAEHARGAAADTTATRMSNVEDVFPEPSDTGLSEQLNQLWNAWSSVANDPSHTAPRAVLLNKAQTVASTLNAMSTSLSGLSANVGLSLTQTATSLTSLAGQLATLNGRIAVATATGADANGLLDQRDVLIGKVSEAVGGAATLNQNGTVDVTVGGQSLVTGTTAAAVTFTGSGLTVGGTPVSLASGSASSELAMLTTTIPGYQAQLDNVATRLMSVVNGAQAAGYDLNGAAGTPMFSGTNASDIAVAFTDPNLVAASGTPGGTFDGGNALAAAAFGSLPSGPDAAYVQMVGDIGSASALASQQRATQATVTRSVDDLRTSASGVSYDEEVSNMLTYQHAYSAASRVLTTIDDMLDTLINHTGLVGRG